MQRIISFKMERLNLKILNSTFKILNQKIRKNYLIVLILKLNQAKLMQLLEKVVLEKQLY